MIYLRQLFLVCAVLLTCVTSLYAKRDIDYLSLLDKEVAHYQFYIHKQEAEIARLYGNLKVASTITDKYLSTKQLAMAYSKFNSDSALVYFRKCQDLGGVMDNRIWYQEASIEEIRICADRGDDFSATNILNKLGDVETVDSSLQAAYASASLLRFIKYQTTINSDSTTLKEAQEIWHTLSNYLDKEDMSSYLYYIYFVPNYNAVKVEQGLRVLLKKNKDDNVKLALGYLVLYYVLEKEGKADEAFDALVCSAMSDIKAANRSSSSLLHIVELLYNRSYDYPGLPSYVNVCMENVANYKDMGRCIQLVSLQNKIGALQAQKGKRSFVILLAICVIFVLVCLILLYIHYCLRRKMNMKLALYRKQKEDLISLSSDLRQKQEELQLFSEKGKYQMAKDKYSDEMLVKSVVLWSSILRDNRSFKKEIANFLQAGLQRKAKDLVQKAVSYDQSFNQMFAWFDGIFLSLHPDFIERMNGAMAEDCQFVLEEKQTLSPELRIFALISLGVNDTATIADILHYSSQTVYNYKSKVCHGTRQPKFDLQKFASDMY